MLRHRIVSPGPHARTTGRALALGLRLVWVTLCAACVSGTATAKEEHVLMVRASAFNSVAEQTDDDPSLTAWGDRLEPGMKALAISRDLIALGLGHGTRVTIEGLPGEYIVMDKMAARWRKKIDIYMGVDIEAAKAWGVREVRIRW
jgi:3D (Asp-Asp-Asp) domain-containing protein